MPKYLFVIIPIFWSERLCALLMAVGTNVKRSFMSSFFFLQRPFHFYQKEDSWGYKILHWILTYKDIRIPIYPRMAHHTVPNSFMGSQVAKIKGFQSRTPKPMAPKYGICGRKMGPFSEKYHKGLSQNFKSLDTTFARLEEFKIDSAGPCTGKFSLTSMGG